MEWLIYIIVGMLSGVLAGLFGIGGGLVIIPLLIYTLTQQGVNPDVITHIAIATSLAIIFFTSINAVIAQSRYHAVNWRVFLWMTIGILFGSLLGAFTASYIDGRTLQIIIGLFSLAIAFELIWETIKPQLALTLKPERVIKGPVYSLGGVVIGCAAAIFGIGGGTLTVPYLNWCRLPMQTAAGTSSACALPISIMGTIGYVVTSWQRPDLPEWSIGYIYLPALVSIAIMSSIFARVGVRLAHRLSAKLLKRSFALLLILIAINFMFNLI